MPTDVDRFNEHVLECENCTYAHRAVLCAIGEELLYEAADDLPESWQEVCRSICERNQRQKEADANFEYYKETDEP